MDFDLGYLWARDFGDAIKKLAIAQSETKVFNYFVVREQTRIPEAIEVYVDKAGNVLNEWCDDQTHLRRRLIMDGTPRQHLFRFSGSLN